MPTTNDTIRAHVERAVMRVHQHYRARTPILWDLARWDLAPADDPAGAPAGAALSLLRARRLVAHIRVEHEAPQMNGANIVE